MTTTPADTPGDERSSAEEVEHARIVGALTRLVFEHGYTELDLATLLAHAGVDSAAFARHFSGLEDCFCRLLQDQTDELMARVPAKFFGESDWRHGLRAVAHELYRFLREDPERARMMVVDSPTAGPRAQLIRDQGMQALIELIDLGRKEPSAPASLTRFTAETTGSAIYDRMRVDIERGDMEALEQHFPELMYSAVLPYLGSEIALEESRVPVPDDWRLRAGASGRRPEDDP